MSTVSQGRPNPGHEPGRRDAPHCEPGPDLGLAGVQRSFDWILFQSSSSLSSGQLKVWEGSTLAWSEFRTSRPRRQDGCGASGVRDRARYSGARNSWVARAGSPRLQNPPYRRSAPAPPS